MTNPEYSTLQRRLDRANHAAYAALTAPTPAQRRAAWAEAARQIDALLGRKHVGGTQ